MRKSKVVTLTVAMLCMIMIVITACGSGGNTGSNKGSNTGSSGSNNVANEEGKTDQAINLGITWAGSQARHDATLEALDIYEQNNSGITFEPTYMGFDTYFTQLATLSAARKLPDIMQIDTGNLMDYGMRDQLSEISGIDTSNIDEKLLSAGVVDGKQFGIPIGVNAITFMYNKVAFDKLGVTIPEEGLSWDEWIAVAREIKPKLEPGNYVLQDLSIATGTTESDKYEIFQLAYGKGFLHTPDGQFSIDKDTYIAFNELFAELREEGIVPPADVTAGHKQYDPMLDNFLNGTVLVQRDYAAGFPAFDSVHPDQYAMTLVPHALQSGGFLLPSQFFTISKSTEHLEEAQSFIDWFVNDVTVGKVLDLVRGVPVSSIVLEELETSLSSSDLAQVEVIDKVAPEANAFSSRPKGYGAWTDEWTKISQAVGFGMMTPEEAYEELKKKWDEIIQL